MVSGTFEVGETVKGEMGEDYDPSGSDDDNTGDDEAVSPTITFRVASTNHKYGPYDDATDTYNNNPYDRPNQISESYSES